jgi:hypothetical protein
MAVSNARRVRKRGAVEDGCYPAEVTRPWLATGSLPAGAFSQQGLQGRTIKVE